MHSATFIDSTVMLNFLDVPGKNERRSSVIVDFKSRQLSGTTFVLPVTTIVESGNHVAQLAGKDRRRCGKMLVAALEQALVETPPWVLTGLGWDHDLIAAIVEGSVQRPRGLELIDQGLGLGDIGILAEIDAYRVRIPSATPIELWTLDKVLLEAYAG